MYAFFVQFYLVVPFCYHFFLSMNDYFYIYFSIKFIKVNRQNYVYELWRRNKASVMWNKILSKYKCHERNFVFEILS